ncbi:MAG: hypothetical protein OXF02_07060 [Simkaniaceae bacterium]|nr:hypothetical protein [Simkaniaceae bacterium]
MSCCSCFKNSSSTQPEPIGNQGTKSACPRDDATERTGDVVRDVLGGPDKQIVSVAVLANDRTTVSYGEGGSLPQTGGATSPVRTVTPLPLPEEEPEPVSGVWRLLSAFMGEGAEEFVAELMREAEKPVDYYGETEECVEAFMENPDAVLSALIENRIDRKPSGAPPGTYREPGSSVS